MVQIKPWSKGKPARVGGLTSGNHFTDITTIYPYSIMWDISNTIPGCPEKKLKFRPKFIDCLVAARPGFTGECILLQCSNFYEYIVDVAKIVKYSFFWYIDK